MKDNLYPTWFGLNIKAKASSYVLTGVSLASFLVGGVQAGLAIKLVLFGISAASAITARYSDDAVLDTDELLDNEHTVSLTQYQNRLFDKFRYNLAKMTEPKKPYEPKLFDWATLADRNKYPAIFIAGKQGTGKTTIAEWLGCYLPGTGKRYAVSPHMSINDFDGFDGTFGGGANIWDESDSDIADSYSDKGEDLWSAIASGAIYDPSIYLICEALQRLVNGRLLSYSKGVNSFDPIDLYIDETIGVRQFFQFECPDKRLKKFWARWLSFMLTQPRKVGVRVWILTQEDTVEALGIQGFSGLKNQSLWIRLNHNAIDEAKRLKRQRKLTADDVSWLEDQERPVLVEEDLAILPEFTEMKALISNYAKGKLGEDINDSLDNPLLNGDTSPNSKAALVADSIKDAPVENRGNEPLEENTKIDQFLAILAGEKGFQGKREEIREMALATTFDDKYTPYKALRGAGVTHTNALTDLIPSKGKHKAARIRFRYLEFLENGEV